MAATVVDGVGLLRRLQKAYAQFTQDDPAQRPIIASDGDDTIWRGDIGEVLFAAALRDKVLRPEALAALQQEAREHGLAPANEVHEQARQLFVAYEKGRYPDARAFAAMAWMFAGWPEQQLAEYCDGVLDDWGFDRAVRSSMRAVLRWAQERQLEVWLVSASPHLIVQRAASRLGLSADCAVAMQSAEEAGIVQPRLQGEPTYADGKVKRLRAVTDAPMLAAFGDSGFDAALMAQAQLPVAVHPKTSLQERLAELPNAIVLQ